jgi:MFS family permease
VESSTHNSDLLIRELQEESENLQNSSRTSIGPIVSAVGCRAAYPYCQSTLQKHNKAIGEICYNLLLQTLGRRKVFVVAFALYTLWTSVCAAAQNVWTLIIFRFLAGTFGSSAFSLSQHYSVHALRNINYILLRIQTQ